MTKCEAIMVANRPEWTKAEWTDAHYVRQLRAERSQYTCDEAPYYVESVHPRFRESRPHLYCPRIIYAWSLAAAKRRAYMERKNGRKATIYDNMTDKMIN